MGGITSSPASRSSEPLTDGMIRSWREQGFALVGGLFEEALLDALVASASAAFPAAGSAEAEAVTGFGSQVNFPSALDGFNALTLHPRLLAAVAQLLGVSIHDLRLTQADLWAKYGRQAAAGGRYDNQDQRIHMDYPNHMLVHPTPWARPCAVEMIVYLDDFTACGGATALVARQGEDDPAYQFPLIAAPGIGELDYINDRTAAEEYLATERPEFAEFRQTLYAREQQAEYRAGDVLLYRHDIWHRGTPMRANARRLAMNVTFRRADAEWIGTLHKGWCWSAYRKDHLIERLIGLALPEQRSVLGFPPPGSDYWCEATLNAVSARYAAFGFDAEPYRVRMDAR